MREVSSSPSIVDLRQQLHRARTGPPMLVVVPGSGLVARCAVESGADALMILSAGLYRTLGTGSLASFLPYGNANEQTEFLLRDHVLPQAGDLPVVAGVFAADPTCPIEDRLRQLRDMGVQGVVNWPAIGFIDGVFREALEDDGLGSAVEAEMLALAKDLGLVTFGFALGVAEVEHFIAAQVDALVLDLGLTHVSGDIRAKRDQLHQAISRLNLLSQAASRNRDCLRLAFGGPITAPEDLDEVFRHSSIHGFAGGSVFERIPVREIVGSTIRRFKGVAMGRGMSAPGSALGEMVGGSASMQHVFELVRRIAPQDVTVCIEGESGTGKELIATQLHRLSSRANQPFVTLNCGAIPEGLLESELFGHERGAFTGAERRRPGKFELAHRGTLFLDEIADLSPRGQVALLRVLQEREVVRVGGDTRISVDVRVITASNRPLDALVSARQFRPDLYYRLSALTISLPPLRERMGDIAPLVESMLADLQARLNREIAGISSRFHEKLRSHVWPGNVRELQQMIYRAALLEDGPILDGLFFEPQAELPETLAPRRAPRTTNRERAETALRGANGNKSQAAATLNVTRRTFYRWLREV